MTESVTTTAYFAQMQAEYKSEYQITNFRNSFGHSSLGFRYCFACPGATETAMNQQL